METFTKEYRPFRPWASNDVKNQGVTRKPRQEALGMKYIQANVSGARNLIILDIDQDDAAWGLKSKIFDDSSLPVPHFISTNPGTGHAHYGLFIEGVAKTGKQLHAFEKARRGLSVVAGGDPFYSGNIFRNPLSGWADTEFFEAPLYTFKELQAFTANTLIPSRKEVLEQGEGRNVTLFERGRAFAYREYYKALRTGSTAFFADSLEAYLVAENALFPVMLPRSEVLSVCRSIDSWVSRTFSLKGFEKKQEAQRVKSAAVRRSKALDKFYAISEILETGASLVLACETLGLNYGSVRASLRKWEALAAE